VASTSQVPRHFAHPLIVIVFVLANCSPAPSPRDSDPVTSIALQWDRSGPLPALPVDDPPASIVVRWPAATGSLHEAQKTADRHCLEWNRYAQPIFVRVDGGIGEARFVCRLPALVEGESVHVH
jgi:hypothetical protein